MVYGMGGVGKTTFAATFPKPLLLDFENGAKYFGERGISVDVANMADWFTNDDFHQLKEALANYETIIIDPIGEAMDKLINTKLIQGKKYRQDGTGDLTMAGWGEVKRRMRNFIKWLRDTQKNVVLVAHVDEKQDDQHFIRRPLMATKLSDELVTMVDVVAYMGTVPQTDDEGNTTTKRVLFLDPSDDKTVSKDRTGKLGKFIKPDYGYIAEQLGYNAPNTQPQAPQDAPQQPKQPETNNQPSQPQNAPTEAPETKEYTRDEKMELLEGKTLAELKAICEKRGLPVSGTKTALIIRIVDGQ